MEAEGKAPATLAKLRWFRDLLDPQIGDMPIGGVSPHDLLLALKAIECRGHHETAIRTRGFAGRIFRYAIATLRAEHNHAEVLRGALLVPKVTHRAAILDPRHIGELLRAIDRYAGREETRIALQLAPHVFLRPGELRTAEWNDIDFEEAVWTIPAARTKMRRPHAVPLSKQALALLTRLRAIGNQGRFLFPALHNWQQPICENNLNNALRRLGYEGDEMTAHGFRAMASTLLNESGLWQADAIERAMAHCDPDPVRAAYNRASYWDERVRMAQWWSDHLDGLREIGNVIHVDFCRRRLAKPPSGQDY